MLSQWSKTYSFVVAGLAMGFVVLALLAVAGKSPTFDEPLHTPAGLTYLRLGDFRANPEHPVLWKCWAALPCLLVPFDANTNAASWTGMLAERGQQWDWGLRTMYQSPKNDPGQLIGRSRFMMALLAVPLLVVIGIWAFRLCGAAAACIATCAIALDPNFLAHAPLVTNDVALSGAFLCSVWLAWCTGRHLSWWNAALLAISVGVAINLKFTGLLLLPVVAILLLVRALLPGQWEAGAWTFSSRLHRLLVAGALCLFLVCTAWLTIWACYGFRFSASSAGPLNFEELLYFEKFNRVLIEARRGRQIVSTEDIALWEARYEPSLLSRVCMAAQERRALPEAFLYGVQHVYANGILRAAYLLGETKSDGWFYYFPLTFLFKTPTAVLVSLLLAAALGLTRAQLQYARKLDVWSFVCLLVPPALYLALLMTSNLNLGVRHLLPIYPFLFIILGCLLAVLWSKGWVGRATLITLGLVLAMESLLAFPNFLPFFNTPSILCAGNQGKLRLLGDSNLDWGQDLPALAAWQREHPDELLYLSYFGTADPTHYGIRYQMIGDTPPDRPLESAVIAISSSHMQGLVESISKAEHLAVVRFLHERPLAVLGGGSIRIYRWSPE